MRIEKAKEEQMEEILNIYREARQFMREQGNPDQWGEEYPRREMLEQDMKKGELVCLSGSGRNRRSFYVFYRDRAYL